MQNASAHDSDAKPVDLAVDWTDHATNRATLACVLPLQSTLAPESRTTLLHFRVSRLTNCSNACDEPAIGSAPSGSSCCLKKLEATTLPISECSRSRMACGVC